MSGMNRVTLIGNIGADPELKYTTSGEPVLKLRLATTETWSKNGEKQERTEWHSVVLWGKRAEALSKILSKGRMIIVEGRIAYRKWDGTDGITRYATDIVAHELILTPDGRRTGASDQRNAESRSGGSYDRTRGNASDDDFGGGYGGGGGDDSDIPFAPHEKRIPC